MKKKILSLALCICTLLSMLVVIPTTAYAEDTFTAVEGETKWTLTKTGDDKGVWSNADGYLGNSAPLNDYFAPYGVGDIFNVVYYLTGPTGTDSREGGFYTIDTTAYSPVTPLSNVIGNVNYPATIMMASSYALWPTDTYRPGYSFTAPKSGTVKFCYSTWMLSAYHNSENLLIYKNGGTENYLIKDQKIYDNASAYTQDCAYNGGSSEHHPYYYLEVEVEKGDVIYFLADPIGNDFSGDRLQLWINSVEYTSVEEESESNPYKWSFNRTSFSNDPDPNGFFANYNTNTTLPFEYVYYNRGWQGATDSRAVGFYPLTYNGDSNNPRYVIPSTDASNYCAGLTANLSGHIWFPTDSYFPGVCFTSPVSGSLTMEYAFSGGGNVDGVGLKIYKNSLSEDTLLNSDNSSDADAKFETKQTVTFDVASGDKIYIMIDCLTNFEGDWAWFWIYDLEIEEAEPEAEKATILGSGLKAHDELKLRFFVQLDYEKTEDYVISATLDGVAVGATVSQFIDADGTYGKVVNAEDYVYEVIVPVSAKQMTDAVVLSVKKGETELLPENTYTVETYCQYWVNEYKTNSTNLTAAQSCASILFYGNTVQQAQGYKTDNLPNIGDEIFRTLLAD